MKKDKLSLDMEELEKKVLCLFKEIKAEQGDSFYVANLVAMTLDNLGLRGEAILAYKNEISRLEEVYEESKRYWAQMRSERKSEYEKLKRNVEHSESLEPHEQLELFKKILRDKLEAHGNYEEFRKELFGRQRENSSKIEPLEELKIYKELILNDIKIFEDYSNQEIYVSRDPDLYVLYNNCGCSMMSVQDYKSAEQFLKKALELKKDAYPLGNLGCVYLKTKQYRNAIGYFKQALQIDPESVWVLSSLAESYLRLKDRKNHLKTMARIYNGLSKKSSWDFIDYDSLRDISRITLNDLAKNFEMKKSSGRRIPVDNVTELHKTTSKDKAESVNVFLGMQPLLKRKGYEPEHSKKKIICWSKGYASSEKANNEYENYIFFKKLSHVGIHVPEVYGCPRPIRKEERKDGCFKKEDRLLLEMQLLGGETDRLPEYLNRHPHFTEETIRETTKLIARMQFYGKQNRNLKKFTNDDYRENIRNKFINFLCGALSKNNLNGDLLLSDLDFILEYIGNIDTLGFYTEASPFNFQISGGLVYKVDLDNMLLLPIQFDLISLFSQWPHGKKNYLLGGDSRKIHETFFLNEGDAKSFIENVFIPTTNELTAGKMDGEEFWKAYDYSIVYNLLVFAGYRCKKYKEKTASGEKAEANFAKKNFQENMFMAMQKIKYLGNKYADRHQKKSCSSLVKFLDDNRILS